VVDAAVGGDRVLLRLAQHVLLYLVTDLPARLDVEFAALVGEQFVQVGIA
jgi:hypothetical protein